MSDKPVWMERWEQERARVVMAGTYDAATKRDRVLSLFEDDLRNDRVGYEDDCERAKLAAAAPELVRALLAVEWGGVQIGQVHHCPACGGAERHCYDFDGCLMREDVDSTPGCPLDAALTAAGFPTQESRDEARELLAAK